MGLLRKIMIETRNRLTDREEKERRIEERLFQLLPETAERVFIYAATGSEVGTERIIERLLAEGHRVFCPKVVGRDIAFFEIHSTSELKPGYHGIPEPETGSEEEEALLERAVWPDESGRDLCIVPGVTFDEEGNRMGYGAGMYDRFLLAHPVFKLALGFECQVFYKPLDEQDEFDVPMDMLLTEEKLRDWTAAV